MSTPAPSPLAEINAVLQKDNPFAQPLIVKADHIWGKGFPDLEFLNAHASDAVFAALEDIRAGKYSTTSLLITAQNGTGKSHIISRIRHRLQAQGGALFVLANANRIDNLNQIKAGFQQLLADSLSNIGSQGVKQWQELAAAMAKDALQVVNASTQPISPKNLVKKLENSDNEEQVGRWINQLTKAFCKVKPVKDPDIVRAIFWTLSEDEAPYASNWLAGKALAQFKANELRLPEQRQSFDTVLEILSLISHYNELLICFDELDDLLFNDHGLHVSQLVANLVKELFENLHRGVILTVMMPGTWKERIIDALAPGIVNRMTTQGQPCELKYLDSDSTVELVAFFLKEFYDARNLIPPQRVYPFEEGQLRAIGREKPTVRQVLQWCREHCKPSGEGPTPPPEVDPVELAFTNELGVDIKNSLDDNYLLADALFFGFETILGEVVEGVKLEEVTTGVGKRGKKDEYLNFKILGQENGQQVSIGVAVLQYDGGKALGAGFKRLLDEEKRFNLTRGCLIRSKDKPLNVYFRNTYLQPLVQSGGEFVELKENEIKPLMAMLSVYRKRESDYKVTEAEIFNFIRQQGAKYWLGIHNPLLKEILSDPSYQIPADLQDEPEVQVNLISNSEEEDTEALKELAHA
ncbi:ATP-binding protein [Leptolyngbya sp. NK1-12]|uniref:ATP-binding protein n=1 Tax=Leptolyngbya sp. NK1-12 TaxID=2547451 RepID=A0AA96WJ35_9CYAN|nr:AAA family ATPase [Leptolyngbya sp. NK1-12]WNZ26074.1 ATP-binding protein [Leptolyngbya sp. NK1-12]